MKQTSLGIQKLSGEFLFINGNALSIPLADESVHCVVTSPPYFNLRSYSTGKWIGGDQTCDHIKNIKSNDSGLRNDGRKHIGLYDGEKLSDLRKTEFKDICGKCGAVRIDDQIGLEQTPDEYVETMVAVFREIRRVLRKDGVAWLNIGDSYASQPAGNKTPSRFSQTRGAAKDGGSAQYGNGITKVDFGDAKPKDLIGIPWRVALALQEDGWWLRSDVIWAKGVSGQQALWDRTYYAALSNGIDTETATRIANDVDPYVGNPMPEPVQDRPTKSHEYIFLLSKNERYFYDINAVKEKMSEATARRDQNGFNGAFKGQFRGSPVDERWQDGRPIEEPKFFDPAGRNTRTVWTIPTKGYPGAHYATWPEDLVEPMIKSSTSEKGVCARCGAPWVRIIERQNTNKSDEDGIAEMIAKGVPRQKANLYVTKERGTSSTVGWRPICKCGIDETVPATVLDPFVGSGTTLLVARRLGRRGIGLDLSMTYLKENAKERLK